MVFNDIALFHKTVPTFHQARPITLTKAEGAKRIYVHGRRPTVRPATAQ